MLETLKLRVNLIESSCLIFVNRFLSCIIIVFFHACGLRWSIFFLQSRRGSQGWQFLFLSRGVSHGRKGGVLLDLCQLFSSMHDYCFLSCMWHQVIDLFPSKQAGIAGMTVSFSITRDIVWPEERSDPKKKSHKKIVLLLIFLGQRKYMLIGARRNAGEWTYIWMVGILV